MRPTSLALHKIHFLSSLLPIFTIGNSQNIGMPHPKTVEFGRTIFIQHICNYWVSIPRAKKHRGVTVQRATYATLGPSGGGVAIRNLKPLGPTFWRRSRIVFYTTS